MFQYRARRSAGSRLYSDTVLSFRNCKVLVILPSSKTHSGGFIDFAELRMNYTSLFLGDVARIANGLDPAVIETMVDHLVKIREARGRLFFLGVGGGAAHASHAVGDFRKIGGFEAYTPVDNVAELTARVNDEGWEGVFVAWLRQSRLCDRDGVFVFSVGGGNAEKKISANIVRALVHAKEVGAKVLGVVGRDGGYTAQVADACVVIPPLNPEAVTPHTEGFQAVLWHLIVAHPRIRTAAMKWESTK